MDLGRHALNRLRGLLQAHGTSRVKRRLWDAEFSRGRWNCLDSTPGDCVYPFVERYGARGAILDLGCGSGTTGNELSATGYRHYTGVDISDVALEKARRRTAENGRAHHHEYVRSDISTYVPARQFDVVLFRDSIYYVPHRRIRSMLERYARHLDPGGVFIVRMANGAGKYRAIVDAIEDSFEVVEKRLFTRPDAIVLVFRPAGFEWAARLPGASSSSSR